MKNIFKMRYLLYLLILCTACEEFVEVEAPKNQIANTKVFKDDTTAKAALNNLYVSLLTKGFLNGNTFGNGYILGCLTDELQVTTNQMTDYRYFFEGAVLSNNNVVKTIWNDSYHQIFICNNIIEGLQASTGVSSEVRNQIIGQCLAARGIIHFYLSQNYGDVPYVTSSDYKVNQSISKTNSAEVLNRAILDLQEAEVFLLTAPSSTERIRINQEVVQAFLARMYLYTQQWNLAKQYAELLIDNQTYELETIDNLFLKTSKSAIWKLKPLNENGNAMEAYSYVFTSSPAPNAELTQSLLAAFETNDLRKINWIKVVNASTASTHSNKYKIVGFTTPSQEYSIIIRIEEMYLIAAEAAAELNDFNATNTYINAIRNRTGLQSLNITNTNDAVNSILKERRVELFCEFGHRFYDLKRRNKLNELLSTKPNWKPYLQNWPIPEGELNLNPNLKPQNDGY